jgi:hypothetical protein
VLRLLALAVCTALMDEEVIVSTRKGVEGETVIDCTIMMTIPDELYKQFFVIYVPFAAT